MHYDYNHSVLHTLFTECGAPGDPPVGNFVPKCIQWLKRCNEDESVDPLEVLGAVLEEYMELEHDNDEEWLAGRQRITKMLAKYGMEYRSGGHIRQVGRAIPTRSLENILRSRNHTAIDEEFERAIQSINSDPEAALTAACSIIESLCKVYIDENGLALPSKEKIKQLWRVVADDLGLDPRSIVDDDLKRVLSGLSSIVDGIGSVRTHAGSAHGRGKKRYRVEPRHARLVAHAAHTLVAFVLETWDKRNA